MVRGRDASGESQSSGLGEPSFDGRIRRGLRSRERILDAIHALVSSGVVQPTVEQIAARAGVGERSVFRHFADLERLHGDMGRRVEREVLALAAPFPPDSGPLAERVAALVRHRAKIFEHIAPFRRAGQVQAHRSASIRSQHEEHAAIMRADLQRLFARELAEAGEAVADAADALASFETWERLRTTCKRSRARAARAIEAGLLRLLA